MQITEGLKADKKSLRAVTGTGSDFEELAKDCVAFANAKGGELYVGIEDDADEPDSDQRVPDELLEKTIKRIHELTINVVVSAQIEKASNGGEYLLLSVVQSVNSIACTSRGMYYVRDSDVSRPIKPDELLHFMQDRAAYCWETSVTQDIDWKDADAEKTSAFETDIRKSERASAFVKEKTLSELLEYYQLITPKGKLTNLGVLWIGTNSQRAGLMHRPTVQYIKYDAAGSKVSKIMWDDFTQNPKELIEDIWQKVPDWRESMEISQGLWRKQIPAYDEVVVREVLCNAFAHRPYTTRGDVFVNVYPDRMEVVNPGDLPIGVLPSNILHKSKQRNEHLSRLMFVLGLMEREGSGYDLMYRTLLTTGKRPPEVFQGDDFVKVTIYRSVLSPAAIELCGYAVQFYNLESKPLMALGVVAGQELITLSVLTKALQLDSADELPPYMTPLKESRIVLVKGRGQGMRFYVNPKFTAAARTGKKTDLRFVEPYVLRALLIEDLKRYPASVISEIKQRIPDAGDAAIKKELGNLITGGKVVCTGGRKYRQYSLA